MYYKRIYIIAVYIWIFKSAIITSPQNPLLRKIGKQMIYVYVQCAF